MTQVVVFDVNETLSDMAPLAQRFADIGAPPALARLWFAALLRDGFARTAAGICVLQLCGEYEADQIPRDVEYLKENQTARDEHFWYGHYYAAHAMRQVGGKEWADWYDRIKSTMLPIQSADGSWSRAVDRENVGAVYATSIAVIALSVPANYLPIFQR